MATNFWQNWRNDLHSTSCRFETDSSIAIPIKWRYLCSFDEDRSSNHGDYEGRNCTFLDEMAKIGLSHQISKQVGLIVTTCFGRNMYVDYKTDIRFIVAEGKLLW